MSTISFAATGMSPDPSFPPLPFHDARRLELLTGLAPLRELADLFACFQTVAHTHLVEWLRAGVDGERRR